MIMNKINLNQVGFQMAAVSDHFLIYIFSSDRSKPVHFFKKETQTSIPFSCLSSIINYATSTQCTVLLCSQQIQICVLKDGARAMLGMLIQPEKCTQITLDAQTDGGGVG